VRLPTGEGDAARVCPDLAENARRSVRGPHPVEAATPILRAGQAWETSPVIRFWDAELFDLTTLDGRPTEEQLDALRAIRRETPIGRGPFGPVVLRHDDVAALAADRRLRGPGLDILRLQGITSGPIFDRVGQLLLFMEGDDHHRIRRLVSAAFTPRAVEQLRGLAREVLDGLVDGVDAEGRCDAATALCDPYPVPVICALVGIPSDRWEDMSRWARVFLYAIGLEAAARSSEILAVIEEMDAYLLELIAERRTAPTDDLLSALIAANLDGDRLSSDELLSVVFMLLVGGTDTTRNQLSLLLHTFATHPAAWAMLRARPELLSSAVEEGIRWDPATGFIPRVAITDLEFGDVVVPAGSIVVLNSRSANHDETALPGAERFDITRVPPPGWRLLTFGAGIHFCLGAALARLELQEGLACFVDRFETLRLDGTPERNGPASSIDGFEQLPIAWTSARPRDAASTSTSGGR
jgi:cytochrome P450